MNNENLIEQMNNRKKFKIMVSILGGLSNIDSIIKRPGRFMGFVNSKYGLHHFGEVIVKKNELVKKEYFVLLGVWQSQNIDGSWGYHSSKIDFYEFEEFVEEEKQSRAYLNYLENKLKKEIEVENGYYKDF